MRIDLGNSAILTNVIPFILQGYQKEKRRKAGRKFTYRNNSWKLSKSGEEIESPQQNELKVFTKAYSSYNVKKIVIKKEC